ncbi:expressed unknown protein [Seminavis robusta]|uniref:Ricin B lectin domain-containing protein n=1 Tax=Seminavis robusta TaxID=568900 RepID=A0A9N8E1W2_9STRA|nr:expressed unknown protein [Seminavis robusta]|eukprot:Sro567_g168070.1 n/a (184) ;mRNA; r:46597-47148
MVGFFNNIVSTWTTVMCMCNAFRIQLYWEEGYMWQDVDYEFEQFCMMHTYRGFPGFGTCFYGTSIGWCQDDAVYIAKCTGDRRQKWTFEPLTNGEFQIKALSKGTCMELIDERQIRLRDCDHSNARQRWYTPGSTNDDVKFAISQASSNLCMGQLHHPKSGEVIEMNNCQKSEALSTLFWEID